MPARPNISTPVFIGLLVFGLVLIRCLQNALRRGLRGVPGPFFARLTSLYRLKIVGDGNAIATYRHLHDKYGPIVRTGANHVSVSDPKTLPLIYSINSKFRKSAFYSVSVPPYAGKPLDNMFTAVDPSLHRDLRAPTAQVFSMTNMRNYEKHVNDCTDLLFGIIDDNLGKPVDTTTWFQWYAFDAVASITFQRRMGYLQTRSDVTGMIRDQQFFAKYFARIGQLPGLHPYLLGNTWLASLYIKFVPGASDSMGALFQFIEKEIDRYDQVEQQADRTDFLAQLRAKDDPERPNFKRDLMNHLSNPVLAGGETTGISLRSCIYHIVKHPEVKKKVTDEIDQADREGKLSAYITYDESQRLTYVQAAIKEALRVHPPTSFPLERVIPPEGAEILGHKLPGGVVIGTMAPLMHQNKEVYGEDADEYRPERWFDQDTERLKLMDRTFTTFGHGTRGCIGRPIAMLEITKLIPEIFRRYQVDWASDKEEWDTQAYWFWMNDGLVLKFEPRNKNR
ncbi:hypothetical protein CLAIMM_11974 [Cladophialophora immunda]|nr:hypothetical protein CLAIMM_11974 [Cladophialophora immunda]